MSKKYDVFISHKSEHKPWVIWLAESLQHCGFTVFLDIWSLIPGNSWVDDLHRGLEQCRAAVLVATPEVVNSGWVRLEHERLIRRRQQEKDFRFIPIVFGDIPNLPFLDDIQGVDFRDPARYQESLHRLVCGFKGVEPGQNITLSCNAKPPPTIRAAEPGEMVPGESRFLEWLLARTNRPGAPPIMILSRGRRHQGPVIQALLQKAQIQYGVDNLLHMTPPYSEQVGQETYFQELGRQCGFSKPTGDPIAFTAAVDKRLNQGERLFFLISGFENANEACRRELAGTLRALTEQHTTNLRVVLFGGQRLLEQKYGGGKLSFLSHADVEEWPDPDVADVVACQKMEFPNLTLDTTSAQQLLTETGGHSGMVRGCLERWDAVGGKPSWKEWCYVCPELWETWYRLSNEICAEVRASIDRDQFGTALSWPPSALARKLYWADLLKSQGGQLVWRSETIRQVGREVLM